MTPSRGLERGPAATARARPAAAVALWLGSWGVALPARSQEAEAPRPEAVAPGFRDAAKRALPAVVTVRRAGPRSGPPGAAFPEGDGSGVVIDAAKGLVLTNDHVVGGFGRPEVVLHDGRRRAVSQVRRDPRSDLALLLIDPKGLTQADWGDSDAAEPGDWVLAVGQPFGLSGTVTAGVVSGKGRGVADAFYEDLIQTDAAINPGNSGGPLVDLRGRIVGINTAIKTRGGGFEGVGFAVPSARARRVADDLARFGAVRRSYLGVALAPVDDATADRLDQPGALWVSAVTPGSPASEAGLAPGDVLVKIDRKPVLGLGPLQSAVEFAEPGKPITLGLLRNGESVDVSVSPRLQPATPEATPAPPNEPPLNRGSDPAGGPGSEVDPKEAPPRATAADFPDLGILLSEPSAKLVRKYRLAGTVRGLVVLGVAPETPADRAGMEPGMVVTDAEYDPVEGLDDFRRALASRPRGRGLLLRVARGKRREFHVILDDPPGRVGGAPARDRARPAPRVVDAPGDGRPAPRRL